MDEELLNILTKAVSNLDLEWSATEQPWRKWMNVSYLYVGHQSDTPQRPALFFSEVHEDLALASPHGASLIQPEPMPREPMSSLWSRGQTSGVTPACLLSRRPLQLTGVHPMDGNPPSLFLQSHVGLLPKLLRRPKWWPDMQHLPSIHW